MIIRDLSNKQDFKQFLRLSQRKLLGRANSDAEKMEFRRINYRLVRICDFLLADLQQFTLEELQDICKIYEMADVVHDQFYDGRKTEEREENELDMLQNSLNQTELVLQGIFGYEPDCNSPSDVMMRNRLQLTRLIISVKDINDYIIKRIEEVRKEPSIIDYERNSLEINYTSLLTSSKKIIRICTSIQDELTRCDSDMSKASNVEKKIYELSNLLNTIHKSSRLNNVNELVEATYEVDNEINRFIK
ncbi:MAG: hypothetical protein ACI4WW_01685 [Candidatus Coprovivens sp.]